MLEKGAQFNGLCRLGCICRFEPLYPQGHAPSARRGITVGQAFRHAGVGAGRRDGLYLGVFRQGVQGRACKVDDKLDLLAQRVGAELGVTGAAP